MSAAAPSGTDQLALLADFSQAFTESLDIDETTRQAVVRIAAHMDAEAAALFLRDEVSGEAVCRACAGPVDISGLRVPAGQGIVGRAIAEGSVQLIADVQHDPSHYGHVAGFVTRSMVCAPLLTAHGAIGALQVINKKRGGSFGRADAEVLRLLAVPTALALGNARLAAQLLEQNRIRREFQLARQMQKTLLPKPPRDGPIAAVNLPAREISGDFYDFFDLADGRLAFAIGDVAGKGMDAALLMVRASSLLRYAGKEGLSPGRWLTRVNEELAATVVRGMFVCVAVGYYDPATTRVTVASAGFPPLLLCRPDEARRWIPAGGPPLGILPRVEYDEERLLLGDGSLYCFSDGVTDVRGADGAPIGLAGVERLIEGLSALGKRARLRGVVGELRRMRLADDTTILLLEDRPVRPRPLAELTIAAQAAELKRVRQTLAEQFERLGLEPELAHRLILAVDEAAANVVRHAYCGSGEGELVLSLVLEGSDLCFCIRDFAPPVDCSKIRPRDPTEVRPGGLGVHLIDQVMDSWSVAPHPEGGHLWQARKRIPLGRVGKEMGH